MATAYAKFDHGEDEATATPVQPAVAVPPAPAAETTGKASPLVGKIATAARGLVAPLAGILIVLALWAMLAPQVDTSLGALPGPVEVAEQGVALFGEWQAASIIERMLGKVQNQKTAQRHDFSESGLQELSDLHAQLTRNLRLGLSVFVSGDRESAQQLLREKRRFRAQERRLAHSHVARLHKQVVQSIETSSLHLTLISDMKRLNSLFCSSAYAVLEEHESGALRVEIMGGE